jgi:hypothetical protein
MKMNIIEMYQRRGEGYDPFLIREGWQVARLTYIPDQDMFGIQKMDRHLLTDELFILLNGTAVLIAATEQNHDFRFEFVKMQQGIPYNIPAKQWHNIAMDEDAELIIVEKDHTHLGDVEYKPLNQDQVKKINDHMAELK